MHVGVERVWAPHRLLYVEQRKICWWDPDYMMTHPDFDELREIGVIWDEVLA